MARKTVLITGCSSGGIGHALAREFARRDVHVFATARSLSKMADLEKQANITLLTLDITSSSSIAGAVASVKSKTGGTLDYLVNNSGSQYVMPVLDLEIDKAKAMFDVNLWGLIAVTQAFAPLLIATQGTIVNVASIVSLLHAPWMALYSASKAAADMTSEILRIEMAPLGVKVITAVTGAVRTEIFTKAVVDPLPEDSMYRAAEQEIHKSMVGDDVFMASTTEEYARGLVSDTLGGKSGHVYRGKMATTVRIMNDVLPGAAIDAMMVRGKGLDKVKESAVKSKKS
ncbi:hypothetical protein MMC10_000889 [Thelotrema lepadinum]|nr:hypothetical protein [Thelotrema lepadinum]